MRLYLRMAWRAMRAVDCIGHTSDCARVSRPYKNHCGVRSNARLIGCRVQPAVVARPTLRQSAPAPSNAYALGREMSMALVYALVAALALLHGRAVGQPWNPVVAEGYTQGQLLAIWWRGNTRPPSPRTTSRT